MGNIMLLIKKYLWFALIGSFLVFIWGFFAWIIARHYQPESPVQTPAQHYTLPKKETTFPISKYQSLFDGSLFFGEGSSKKTGGFQSHLILWGLINGGWAVVGIDPRFNQNTWIVKAGDTVEGEQIVAVGVRYISVRNQTGEGKVVMSE
jgi:hypothetical protein